jgi:UDP-GlcNAc3NAcA epimerase
MRIATVIGARPQFVKAAVVSQAFRLHPGLTEILIHTGQHFDSNMSDVFFEELGIRSPDYHLGIHGMRHGAMTGRMLEEVEKVLITEKPDLLLVYGDTDSTLAGALAAAKLHIPIAHVEAGLRAYNQAIPEEINRVLTDHISTILFTPTEQADRNLAKEGIAAEKIRNVGDVMYDAALHFSAIASGQSKVLSQYALEPGKYILATIHRPQNTDTEVALQIVTKLLDTVSSEMQVVWPVHPRARKKIHDFGIMMKHVMMIDPVGYLDMTELERNAALVMTDSGGVQKEAYFHRVPCVTLRPETEWVELLAHDWNILIPPGPDVVSLASRILSRVHHQGADVQLYGSGQASQRIAEVLSHAK